VAGLKGDLDTTRVSLKSKKEQKVKQLVESHQIMLAETKEEFRAKIDALKQGQTVLETEKRDLTSALRERSSECHARELQEEKLQAQVDTLTKAKSHAEEEARSNAAECRVLQTEAQTLERERERLARTVETRGASLEQHAQQLGEVHSELDARRQDLRESQAETSGAKRELVSVSAQLEESQHKVEFLEESAQKSASEREIQRNNINALEKEKQTLEFNLAAVLVCAQIRVYVC
jgi:chromosome segregation ATPase